MCCWAFVSGTDGSGGNHGRVGILCGWLSGREVIALVNLPVMRTADRVQGRRHICEEVKAVSDLGGLGSALPNACGVGFGAVPRHDLDAGMGVKPRGHRLSRSICQHIKGAPPVEIDDDGAVALALAPRPIIHPNNFRGWPIGPSHAAHTPQEGVATPWYSMARQVSRTGRATEGQSRVGLHRGDSRRRARRERRHAREPFGKGLATTRAGTTPEATHE